MQSIEKNCQISQTYVKLQPETIPLAVLQAIYEKHLEISREQGCIATLQDETEKVIRTNLDQIRKRRYSVKIKQQELRRMVEDAGLQINFS